MLHEARIALIVRLFSTFTGVGMLKAITHHFRGPLRHSVAACSTSPGVETADQSCELGL